MLSLLKRTVILFRSRRVRPLHKIMDERRYGANGGSEREGDGGSGGKENFSGIISHLVEKKESAKLGREERRELETERRKRERPIASSLASSFPFSASSEPL